MNQAQRALRSVKDQTRQLMANDDLLGQPWPVVSKELKKRPGFQSYENDRYYFEDGSYIFYSELQDAYCVSISPWTNRFNDALQFEPVGPPAHGDLVALLQALDANKDGDPAVIIARLYDDINWGRSTPDSLVYVLSDGSCVFFSDTENKWKAVK